MKKKPTKSCPQCVALERQIARLKKKLKALQSEAAKDFERALNKRDEYHP